MVDAMGTLGVEGVFRRSCELTMKLFRQHKDIFLSVLRPFIFDPLLEWKESQGSAKSFGSASSKYIQIDSN
jgi:serine/threonine-protein kinase ATR